MRTRLLLILFFSAGLVYILTVYRGGGGVSVGDHAPHFILPSQEASVSLDSFHGKKTVLINFWATWCPACLAEMPSLERLYGEMNGKNFEIVAVSLDEGWKPVEAFLQRIPVSFPIVLDEKGRVAQSYGTFQLPESFLIDREGKVVQKYTGPREWDDPEIVQEILKFIE